MFGCPELTWNGPKKWLEIDKKWSKCQKEITYSDPLLGFLVDGFNMYASMKIESTQLIPFPILSQNRLPMIPL